VYSAKPIKDNISAPFSLVSLAQLWYNIIEVFERRPTQCVETGITVAYLSEQVSVVRLLAGQPDRTFYGDILIMNNENDEVCQDSAEGAHTAGKSPADITICYLTCPKDAATAFLGALMVTDSRGRPLHFSFVSPVRPTRVQRILYGSTLEEHVKIDVISQKLLSDIPFSPDVIFVDTEDMLSVRRIVDIPTAFLAKRQAPENDPTRLTTLQYNTGSNMDDQETVGRILSTLEPFVDLVEPFARMREALKEVIKSPDA